MHGNILAAHLMMTVVLMQAKKGKAVQHLFLHAIQYFSKPLIAPGRLPVFYKLQRICPTGHLHQYLMLPNTNGVYHRIEWPMLSIRRQLQEICYGAMPMHIPCALADLYHSSMLLLH